MTNCAIVCEYNPFHSGHKYQLDCVRNHSFDNIICVMSGNFVQSARPAICDKTTRTACAIKGGANAVIELPTVYATASAGFFADGAIKIISDIKNITHIAMGATASRDAILRIAEIKIKHSNELDALRARLLKNGKSYNFATTAAISELYSKYYTDGSDIESIVCEPNNMLCIEYICALYEHSPDLEPLVIERRGALHGAPQTDTEHISATAIRNALWCDDSDAIKRYVPFDFDLIAKSAKNRNTVDAVFNDMAVFALKSRTTAEMSTLRNCADGMENMFFKTAKLSNYEDIVKSECCKRYGKKRIDRFLLDCMLDIKKEYLHSPFCTRLLGCRSGFDFSILPEFVKTDNAALKSVINSDSPAARVLNVDIRAAALYNTLTHTDGGYFNYSLVKL